MLSPATYIDTAAALSQLVDYLKTEPLLAIDTESNSMYVYQEQVCLIQLSTWTKDFIIDPLAIEDLQPLGILMESPQIEKIFHGAEYDVVCLKRDFGFSFNNLFDTMIAARICGFESFGLGNLLEAYAGVDIDKSHQRDNWGLRPLPEDSLIYAQMDTHFLPYLRDELQKLLVESDHLEEAQELFNEVALLPASEKRNFDQEGYWHLGKPNFLNQSEMMILREVYLLREEIAHKANLPPLKVLNNNMLVTIARGCPNTVRQLHQKLNLPPSVIRRYGRQIVKAVKRGKAATELPPPPRPKRPDSVITHRYTALHSWRRERAIERGVDSDVIISKKALWDLAYKAPTSLDELKDISHMGPWRMANYGEEILNVLEDCP